MGVCVCVCMCESVNWLVCGRGFFGMCFCGYYVCIIIICLCQVERSAAPPTMCAP